MEIVRSSIPSSSNSSMIQSLRVKAEWESKNFILFHCSELTSEDLPVILMKMSEPESIIVFNEADRLSYSIEEEINKADKNVDPSSQCFKIVFSPERDDE